MPGGLALAALGNALRARVRQMVLQYDAIEPSKLDMSAKAPEELSNDQVNKVTLSIFPYHLSHNTGWQSSRDPAYNSAGERRENPWLPLDVRYVLSAYGPGPDYEMALGAALLAMHETPQITPEWLANHADNGSFSPNSPLPQAVRDLAAQPAPIRVRPLHMTGEDLSQVWSSLNAGVHPGYCFEVGTVLMEYRAPRTVAPPVAEGRLSVTLLRRPRIERMRFAPAGAGEPQWTDRNTASPGERVRLDGTGLRGDIVEIAVGKRMVAPAVENVRPDRILATLPGDLFPGLVTLQVRHRWPKPEGETPPPAAGEIPGETSNLLPLSIRPVLDTPAVTLDNEDEDDGIVSFDATIHFDVAVGGTQEVELLLRARVADPDGRFRSYSFHAVPDAAASTATRVAPISAVPPGSYLVRVLVDGAESALTSDATGYSGPLLQVPA